MTAEDYKSWINDRLNREEARRIDLKEVFYRLDQSWHFIEQGELYHRQAIIGLHRAVRALVDELARRQPIYPETTEAKEKQSE